MSGKTVLIAGTILIYLFLCLRHISLPAPTTREAIHALPALYMTIGENIRRNSFIVFSFFGKDIFLASDTYSAWFVETYLLLPLFKIFGGHVWLWRTLAVLLALIAAFIFAKTASLFYGKPGFFIAFPLILLHEQFVLNARVGLDSESSVLWLLFAGTIWGLTKWWKTGEDCALYLSILCMGIGVYQKILFLWIIVSVFVGWLLFILPKRKLYDSHLDWLALIGIIVIAFYPLILLNIKCPLGTLKFIYQFIFQPTQGPSNANYIDNLLTRLQQFYLVFFTNQYHPGSIVSQYLSWSKWWIVFFPFSLFIKSVRVRLREYRVYLYFLLTIMVVYISLSPIHGTGLAEYHLFPLVPIYLLICTGLLSTWIEKKKLVVLFVSLLVFSEIFVIYDHLKKFQHSADLYGLWDGTLYELTSYLDSNKMNSPVAIRGAIGENVEFLTQGRVKPICAACLPEDKWVNLINNPKQVYIFPHENIQKSLLDSENDIERLFIKRKLKFRPVQLFYNRNKEIVFSVVQLDLKKVKSNYHKSANNK